MPMARAGGVVPNDAAIGGRAVAMTVPSRFSMKNAPATRSATGDRRPAGLGVKAVLSLEPNHCSTGRTATGVPGCRCRFAPAAPPRSDQGAIKERS